MRGAAPIPRPDMVAGRERPRRAYSAVLIARREVQSGEGCAVEVYGETPRATRETLVGLAGGNYETSEKELRKSIIP